ncbi:MAG TPA: D-2-hydroxyacid dehydrogenase [Saprospiraceae bacterium]|nr:D-2-hydroxyacid dehydrogenase [Saprospiraceae bacterium]MCB9270950.1 D-2-hydroxyacid dehydrogenase [Lewinellaceae bacterium]HPG08167.1 D-2-hydroxyacid dehydrogenase [Saprospiraceae bacterium]HPQ98336.1 D-2-hydroxyacid dehydrogenase [Saprospiraceae bacterium]HQU51378.1 D-2-hydroxyacid dehydrogenase [Saprospiraceae bacterium]
MIRILVNDGIEQDGQTLLEEANFIVDTEKIPQEELPQRLPDYDVIIVRSATKVRKELIDKCPNLKVIARGGVGLDNIDVDYAQSKGITVFNTPAASSKSVAELAFAHIFALARGLHLSNRELPKGSDFAKLKKRFSSGFELRGRTLGILGLGRIGQESARIALALGMHVIPVDIVIDEAEIDIEFDRYSDIKVRLHLESEKMDTMLQEADVITVHVPFKGGKPLIGGQEIARMKDGVILINTARGGAIDEEALLSALDSGKVGGAGIDVFMNEPTPNPILLSHDKVSVTPHIGASTEEAQTRIGLELAERIIQHFDRG